MIYNLRVVSICGGCTSLPSRAMSTVGGDSQETHVTIASERIRAEVIDIPDFVENSKDDVPFPIISFNCKKVPADQACKEAIEKIQSGQGHWGKTDITVTDNKTRAFQLSCFALSCVSMWQALRVC